MLITGRQSDLRINIPTLLFYASRHNSPSAAILLLLAIKMGGDWELQDTDASTVDPSDDDDLEATYISRPSVPSSSRGMLLRISHSRRGYEII